jgi:hypothetical protein
MRRELVAQLSESAIHIEDSILIMPHFASTFG